MPNLQTAVLALRSIRRRPIFYLNVMALLSLGAGVATGTFGLVDHINTRALPYHDSQQLIAIHDVYPLRSDQLLGMSEPEAADLGRLARSFTGTAVIEPSGSTLLMPGARRVSTTAVSASLFPVLGISPSRGRAFNAEDERPASPLVALISDRLSKELNQCATLSTCAITANELTYRVIGVLPATFRLPGELASDHQTDVLFPFRPRSDQYSNRHNPRLTVIGRLNPDIALSEAQREMDTLAETLRAEHPSVYSGDGYLIRVRELRASVLGDTAFVLLMATLAASLLFVLAISNAGTLLLIGNRQRIQAILTALALGAPPSTLRLQLFIESLLISITAFIPGVLLGCLLVLFLARLSAGRVLPLLQDAYPSLSTAAFAVLLSLLGMAVMFLIGQAPLSRARLLLPTIHRGTRTSTATRSSMLMQSLSVTLQMAVSTTLIALFLLVALSQHRLHNVDLGFQPSNLVALDVELGQNDFVTNDSVLAFFSTLLDTLHSQRGLEQSCLATFPPLIQKNETWPFEVLQTNTSGGSTAQSVAVDVISGGCLKVLRLPLLAGSDLPVFKSKDSPPVALVSESFARQRWLVESALGKPIRLNMKPDSPWITIVGVVGDVNHEGPNSPKSSMVYLHYTDIPALTAASVRYMRILTRTTESNQDVDTSIRRLAADIDRSAVVQLGGSVSDLLARLTAPWRLTGEILSVVALVAPIIAISGLFSLISTLAILRRREFAIRTAIGAPRRNIFYLMEKYVLFRIATGGVLGTLASLFLFKRFSAFLPQTNMSEAVVAAFLGTLFFFVTSLIVSAGLMLASTGRAEAVSTYRDE